MKISEVLSEYLKAVRVQGEQQDLAAADAYATFITCNLVQHEIGSDEWYAEYVNTLRYLMVAVDESAPEFVSAVTIANAVINQANGYQPFATIRIGLRMTLLHRIYLGAEAIIAELEERFPHLQHASSEA